LPAVESNTNVVALVIAAIDDVIEAVDINAADPLFAFIDAFVSEMPAFVPDASNIILLADKDVELAANNIVLLADPKFAVSFIK
jgi:hypothetical protein